MKKLISVIIPTYNRQSKTMEAINSVYSISPELIEIIVVDDASLEPFACSNVNCNDIDVRVVRVENNGGAGLARKVGVENAQANIVAFLDSDDCYCSNWLDNVLKLIYKNHNLNLIIIGQVNGASRVHALVYQLLMSAPKFLQLMLTRLITVFFNPFYTPSLMMSKPNCSFHESLRYCEDYYTFSRAVFKADKIYILQNNACIIGREPNTVGGLSQANQKMFAGELSVRKSMFFMGNIPIGYKFIVPLGFLYQYFRQLIKNIRRGLK
jgi:glycosyltransferase involved in cell wall biosynthesis